MSLCNLRHENITIIKGGNILLHKKYGNKENLAECLHVGLALLTLRACAIGYLPHLQ